MYPWQTMAAFFALYVAFTSASLPAASLLTILAGAIFGLGWGVLLVSFASAIGALLAMLAARFVLRDWVQDRFGAHLRGINEGMAREGGFYLFTLRLIPAVPYFLINLAMGLTPIRPWTFYWVSQVAMFPATVLYVNAGTQLARLESLRDVLSWQLIGALRAPRHLPAGGEEDDRARQGAPRLCALAAAAPLRPQPDRHRRGFGRTGRRLYRRRGARPGDAGREAAHGRRLPVHRLRAVEGPDQVGTRAVHHPQREGLRSQIGNCGLRLRRRDGARAARGAHHRAARLRRALYAARRRVPAGHGEDHLALDGRDRRQAADHARHRHRGWSAPADPEDSRDRKCAGPHLRQRVGAAQASGASRGAGRRTDRLRARAGIRALRLESHPGRDAAAHPRARGSRGLGNGGNALSRRGHRCAGWTPCGPRGEACAGLRVRERDRVHPLRLICCARSAGCPTPAATASRSSASR